MTRKIKLSQPELEISYINGDASFTVNGDIIATGDLTVSGTTTTINSTDLNITDNTIILNKDETGAGVTAGTSGVEVERGTEANVRLQWNEATDSWQVTTDGVTYHNLYHQGNSGTGSGLDADTLQGLDSTQFLRSDADDTASGKYVFSAVGNAVAPTANFSNPTGHVMWMKSGDVKFVVADGSEDFNIISGVNNVGANDTYANNTDGPCKIGMNSESGDGFIRLQAATTGTAGNNVNYQGVLDITPTGLIWNSNTVLTSADVGPGNGLDADTVDGLDGNQFLRSDADDSASGVVQFTNRIETNEIRSISGSVLISTTLGLSPKIIMDGLVSSPNDTDLVIQGGAATSGIGYNLVLSGGPGSEAGLGDVIVDGDPSSVLRASNTNDFYISGGGASGTDDGGDLILSGGTATGTGQDGQVLIDGAVLTNTTVTGELSGGPYDISFFIHEVIMAPLNSNTVMDSFMAVRSAELSGSGHFGYAKTPPSGATSYTIRRIRSGTGVSMGTVDFAAGSPNATFTLTANTDIAPGDIIEIVNPGTPDNSILNVSITLHASLI